MTKIERIAVLESQVGRLLDELRLLREQVDAEHRALRKEFHDRMEAERQNKPVKLFDSIPVIGPGLVPSVAPTSAVPLFQQHQFTISGGHGLPQNEVSA